MKKLSRLLGTVLLLLSCSTFAMADPISIALPDPGTGGPSGPSPFDRYTFTWSGVIQGFADGSPFEMFNGQEFTLSGFYFSNGTFDFTRMDFVGLPDPDGGGADPLSLYRILIQVVLVACFYHHQNSAAVLSP